jgi:hypothetical protein
MFERSRTLAHDALERFDVRVSPTFLSSVMHAAGETPRALSWFYHMLQIGDQWAPAARCLTVVLALGALLGTSYW